MKKLNHNEIIQQFQILQVPITATIDNLRRARDRKLRSLYERSSNIENPVESLALDTEIATIQHAYLYIKKHFDEIHAQIDVYAILKDKLALLELPSNASLEQVRRKRNELLLQLITQDSGKYSKAVEDRIKEIQEAYQFIANNYTAVKIPH